MNAAQRELWRKIEAFQVNQPGTRFTFEDRLARENRWTPEFARRVVGEYKRFLLLAMVAEHPVTPSDEVDQAWHLHMVYTESYWEDLCGRVLGRPLHHGPTRGGKIESIKYHNLYELTLDSYRRVFGHDAPEDVWPATRTRFGRAPNFQRVNTAENWVVPKLRLTPGRVMGAGATLVAASLTGCGVFVAAGSTQPGTSLAPLLLIPGLLGMIGLVVWVLARSVKAGMSEADRMHRPVRRDSTSGCTSAGNPMFMVPGTMGDPNDLNGNGVPDNLEGGHHGSHSGSHHGGHHGGHHDGGHHGGHDAGHGGGHDGGHSDSSGSDSGSGCSSSSDGGGSGCSSSGCSSGCGGGGCSS